MVYAFWCANGFLGFCHTFLKWGFISGCGTYWWSSFLRKQTSDIWHFVFMCHSSTFLSYLNNTSFFFLPISFGEFGQENYADMWWHYGSKVMGVCLTPDFFWWYNLLIYGGLCHIYIFRELAFGGSIFVLHVLYFW
jgi:hypothetical protein